MIVSKDRGSKVRCAALLMAGLIAGSGLCAWAAQAQAEDTEKLAKDPQEFLGKTIELEAMCVKGGQSGNLLGYGCKTKDGIYLNAADITPDEAKTKLAEDCANGTCETTVSFEPHSFTTSHVIEADKKVIIFNAETAEVTF